MLDQFHIDIMAEKLYVIRLVTPEVDGDWIPHAFLPGDIVWEYTGATYGCINWNNGMAVSEFPGETPFFEFPYDALAKPLKV